MRSVAFIALLLALGVIGTSTTIAAPATAMPATPAEAIRSPAALAQYLREAPPGHSPLDLLPPGSRKRFLASLRFGERGLGGFAPGELTTELTDAEIVQVLTLFGAQGYAGDLHGVSPAARELRQQRCRTALACPESPIEQRYTKLFIASESQAPEAQLTALYRELFATEHSAPRLRAMSESDLRFLHRAADLVTADATALHDQMQVLTELQGRHLPIASEARSLRQRLIAARDFAAADKLATHFPTASLGVVPALRDLTPARYAGPSTLTFSARGDELLRQPYDMHAPAQIVVVAGCHFAAAAARDIDADPVLGQVFQRHGLWLSAQSERLDDVRQWNAAHPRQPMAVAWQDQAWTALDSWNMPTFYVFQHGRLVRKLVGWTGQTQAALPIALQEAGLID